MDFHVEQFCGIIRKAVNISVQDKEIKHVNEAIQMRVKRASADA